MKIFVRESLFPGGQQLSEKRDSDTSVSLCISGNFKNTVFIKLFLFFLLLETAALSTRDLHVT